jgi:hypothetical protein
MEPLVAHLDNPHAYTGAAKANTLIAPRAKKKVHTSYYNDMRLVLAASYARDKLRDKAQHQIDRFQQFRRLSGEQPWTVAIEAERGAFVAGSAGETHWLGSLAAAGLPKGEAASPARTVNLAGGGRTKTGATPKTRTGTKAKAKPRRTAKPGSKSGSKPGAKPAGSKRTKAKPKPAAKSSPKGRARKKTAPRSKRGTRATSKSGSRRSGRAGSGRRGRR